MKKIVVKENELLVEFPYENSDRCLLLSKEDDISKVSSFDELIKIGKVIGIENVFNIEKYNEEMIRERELQSYIDKMIDGQFLNKDNIKLLGKDNFEFEDFIKLTNKLNNNYCETLETERINGYFGESRKNRLSHNQYVIEGIISKKEVTHALKNDVKLRESIMNKVSKPSWIIKDGDKRKVDYKKLAKEINKETLTFLNDETSGFWSKDENRWVVCDKKRTLMLKKMIADKLNNVGLWSLHVKKSIYELVEDLSIDLDNKLENNDTDYINFSNGVYSISKDKLLKHDPKYNLTQLKMYPIKKSAKTIEEEDENKKYPSKTIDWLLDLLGDLDTVNYVCRLIGYCYFRSYIPFQKIFILFGSGSNGKSFLLNHVSNMLDESNVSGVSLHELDSSKNQFARQLLVNKEVNIFADIDDGHIRKTGTLKTLSGGDTIMVEAKYQSGYAYKNYAKLLFSANQLPTFSDSSDGFHRRVVVIPFEKKITEEFKKKHKLKKIEEEIPYFSHYCIRLFKEAYDKGDLEESEKIKKATDKCLEQMDNVDRFLSDCCECLVAEKLEQFIKSNNNHNKIDKIEKKIYEEQLAKLKSEYGSPTAEVYGLYKKYCLEEGTKANGKKKFKEKLESNGHIVERKQVNRINKERYIGVFIDEVKLNELGYKDLLDTVSK